jgi:predicted GNAT family acetyltransferase
MKLVKPATLAEFRRLAEPLLVAYEVEHGLIFSISSTPEPPPGAYCALVVDGGRVVAAAVRTIQKAALSREEVPGALAVIAPDLLKDPALQGVLGPRPSVDAFAAASGRRWRDGMAQGIYECRRVIPPQPVAGTFRVVTEADRDILVPWIEGFYREAAAGLLKDVDANEVANRHIASQAAYLWEVDGTPVSYAGAMNRTPNGVRVGPVYTPPEHRRRGYAGALVAAVTQRQLEGGRTFTYLYTDLSNPTSNSIYKKVGYRRVAEAADLWLER